MVAYYVTFYRFIQTSQIGEMEMEILPNLATFNGFSIRLGLFTPLLTSLHPTIVVKAQNTTQGGV